MILKTSMAENFILSAKPPTIKAGVIIAKVSWNIANTVSGISPDRSLAVREERKRLSKFPTKALSDPPSPNVQLYKYTTHKTEIVQVKAKHCISTDKTFLLLTSPA